MFRISFSRCFLVYVVFTIIQISTLKAQELRGLIKAKSGEVLPFTSILAKGTSIGTMANAEGKYEMKLAKGKYEIIFQYLGYKTKIVPVEMGAESQTLNVEMEEQDLQLGEVVIGKSKEDLAYSIMRKAIAKSLINKMMVKAYKAMAYIKGGGKLIDVPFLLEGKLKESGISKNTVFFTESVSELSYRYPNFFKNRAISIRSNMDKYANPNSYLNSSFYNPKVGSAISPLSPRAFYYYKFAYEGAFNDRGFEVNKIKVTPRQKGDDVFDGYIYIIDDLWCIHSLDLYAVHDGIGIKANQIYTPIKNVWMPVNQKYLIKGKIFGFEFEFNYLASLKNYEIEVNPAFIKPIEVVDEKKEPELAKTLKKNEKIEKKDEKQLEELLTSNKPLTAKTLRKVAKAYRKLDQKAEKEKNQGKTVLRIDSTIVDSLAYKRDSSYWNEIRPVPLTESEVKSTILLDSIRQKEEEKRKKDSLKKNDGGGNIVTSALTGKSWFFGKKDSLKNRKHRLKYGGLLDGTEYNTIEGYAIVTSLSYRFLKRNYKTKNFHWFEIGPKLRYATSRKVLNYTGTALYKNKAFELELEGGRYVSQLSPNMIDPAINTLYTTMFERNFMRLYQKDFARITSKWFASDKLSVEGFSEFARRTNLDNHASKPFINWKNRVFYPNADSNLYSGTTLFNAHKAFVCGLGLVYTPKVQYVERNGRQIIVNTNAPFFYFKTRAGIPNVANSKTNYLNASLGVEQRINVGVRGHFNLFAEGGGFLYNKFSRIQDFNHFEGNLTDIIVGDGLRSFRNLPYYLYSNPKSYVQFHGIYTPRRFLLSRIPFIDILGWKESIGLHSLLVENQKVYSECTYGFDGILRMIRLEGGASFYDQKFDGLFFRIGLTLKNKNPSMQRKTESTPSDGEGRTVTIRL